MGDDESRGFCQSGAGRRTGEGIEVKNFILGWMAAGLAYPLLADDGATLSARASSYPSHHMELEMLAREYGYLGGRPQGTDRDGRNVRALTMERDAVFRHQLKLAGYDLLDSIDDKGWTGMQAMVVRDQSGQTTIVFRGTEPLKDGLPPRDLVADFEHSGNVGKRQYEAYSDTLAKWAAKYPNSYVTGHSLGASLAQRYMAEYPGAVKEAALFNAPGISYEIAQQGAATPNRPPCTIYVGKGDPVSELGGSSHLPCRIIEVTSPDISGYSAAAHSFQMLTLRNNFEELDFGTYEQRRRDSYDAVRTWLLEHVPRGERVVEWVPVQPSAPSPEMASAAEQQRRRGPTKPATEKSPVVVQEEAIRGTIRTLRQSRADLLSRLNEARRNYEERNQSLRSGEQRLLGLMAQLNRRMVPLCAQAQSATAMSRSDVERIERKSDEVEDLLRNGQALLDRCPDAAAAEQAGQNLRRATQLAAEIHQANQAVQARTEMESDLAALAELRQVQTQLRAQMHTAEGQGGAESRLRPEVNKFNASLDAQLAPLRVGRQTYQEMFPDSAADDRTARLMQLDSEISQLAIGNAELDAIAGAETQLNLTIRLGLSGDLVDAETLLSGLADCVANATGPSERLGDGIDTADTLAQLAITKLVPRFERSQTACRAKLGAPPSTGPARSDEQDAEARFRRRLAQEEAALKSSLDSARAARDGLAARYESELKTAQGLVAQREVIARAAAGNVAASGIVAELGAATGLCTQAESARQKLADALEAMERYEKDLEASLNEAQKLAASCKDGAMAQRAADQLNQAAGLQTSVDQRAAALALLAVQVDSLSTRRTSLLKRREEAASLIQSAPASRALPPVDFSVLQARIEEMRAHGELWGRQEAERLRQRAAQLEAEFAAVPATTRAAGIARLHPLIDGIVATAWKDSDLQQRADLLAGLRQRAEAAGRASIGAAVDRRTLQAAVQAAACLDTAPPDIRAGMQQADTTRTIAQLATQKLGGATREKLTICTDRLAHNLTKADKQARVAAKVCRYPGSHAIWDEREYRPMCACNSGSHWNTGQTACVAVDKAAEVARADCSRYPNTRRAGARRKGAWYVVAKAGSG